MNTIMPGSHITLPMVPLTGVTLGPELPCGAQEAVRCNQDPGEPVSVPVPTAPTIPELPPVTVPPVTLAPEGGLIPL